jgi:hypothetical protein
MKKVILMIFLFLILIAIGIFVFQKGYFNSGRTRDNQHVTWIERIDQYGYKEYVPIILKQDKLTETQNLLSKKHIKNVIHVLKYHNEKWKIENGKLFISKNMSDALLWNYTTKANDSVWLAEHLIGN